MALYQLKIRGHVQGVGYRYNTKLKADELGLRGIVKNEPDGSVYAEIEGEEELLQRMIEWCRQGPQAARVLEVIAEAAPEQQYQQFNIIR